MYCNVHCGVQCVLECVLDFYWGVSGVYWSVNCGVYRELPRGDCYADSTPLGFNTLLQGAAHLGRLTAFACKSFSIVNPRGRQLKALCRQLRVWNFFLEF